MWRFDKFVELWSCDLFWEPAVLLKNMGASQVECCDASTQCVFEEKDAAGNVQ